jgi:hypothetical protein
MDFLNTRLAKFSCGCVTLAANVALRSWARAIVGKSSASS